MNIFTLLTSCLITDIIGDAVFKWTIYPDWLNVTVTTVRPNDPFDINMYKIQPAEILIRSLLVYIFIQFLYFDPVL